MLLRALDLALMRELGSRVVGSFVGKPGHDNTLVLSLSVKLSNELYVIGVELLFEVLEFLAGVFEEKLAVHHEQDSEEVEEQKRAIRNDHTLMGSQDLISITRQETQPVEQGEADGQKESESDNGDIGNHGRRIKQQAGQDQ